MSFSASNGWIVWLLTIYFSLFPCVTWAAETIAPTNFKNVDEAVGWVKAKGDCEYFGKAKESSNCKIRVELPSEERAEVKGKSSWQVWAWLNTFDVEPV